MIVVMAGIEQTPHSSQNFLRKRLAERQAREAEETREVSNNRPISPEKEFTIPSSEFEQLLAEFQDPVADALVDEADEDVFTALIFKSDLEEEPEWKIPNQ